MSDFAALSLSSPLVSVAHELGYRVPTPIQVAAIPVLLEGRDLIGQAPTGSGKTAAFALPILQRLTMHPRLLQALVLCPTRELSAQVAREIRKLGRGHRDLQVLIVAGGEPARPQREALGRGVHVVVGTPGRLLDHLGRGDLALGDVTTVVLDEADRMLDMGFQKDVEQLLVALPPARQTIFLSATFPDSIEAMSRAHQRDPARVYADDGESTPRAIRQVWLPVEPSEKLHGLFRALRAFEAPSTLVFCNLKRTVAQLGRELSQRGVSVACLHGDLDQFERDQVLARFRNQSVRVLIATDVAGRGIDVEDLELVINYEFPPQSEMYLHRIGRTGRAGQRGVAVSLIARGDEARREAIEQLTQERMEKMTEGEGAQLETLAKAVARPARMATILLSGGRKDKVRPGDVLGALTGVDAGLDGQDIGQIELHDRLCYIAVERSVSRRAVESLNRGRVKGRRFRASFANVGGY